MEDRNGYFGQDGAKDGGFSQSTGSGFAQGQDDSLEESCRLVHGLTESLIEMEVEFLELVNVVTETREEHEVVEPEFRDILQIFRASLSVCPWPFADTKNCELAIF